MMTSLGGSLQARLPGWRINHVYGLFRGYRPGGLRLERLVKFAWVYLCVAFRLLLSRPDAVLVRTTPPGVQLWTAWWARWRDVPVFCWLMDCHPEIEARQLEKRGHPRAARLLRRFDAALMPHFSAIIALDTAMAAFVRTRAPALEIWQHPTWSLAEAATLTPVSYCPGQRPGPLRIAYSGNLGAAHDLSVFAALVAELVRRRPVELYVIGASPAGEERFSALAKKHALAFRSHPRVPFGDLRGLYERWQIDAGLVLLTGESAGLVAPSKFSGYIAFGIPLIYLGPQQTSTAEVCSEFHGGFRIDENAAPDALAAVADRLLDAEAMAAAANGARAASAHFTQFDNESLADRIAPRLLRLVAGHIAPSAAN